MPIKAGPRLGSTDGIIFILYIPEMAQDTRELLFLRRFESSKFAGIPNVTFSKLEYDPTIDFGKKSTLLRQN